MTEPCCPGLASKYKNMGFFKYRICSKVKKPRCPKFCGLRRQNKTPKQKRACKKCCRSYCYGKATYDRKVH